MTPFERVSAKYPDDLAALVESFETPLGLSRSVQFVVDTNLSFLERLLEDGLTLKMLAGLVNDAGFAAANSKSLGRKTLASALTRARARFEPPAPAAPGTLQAGGDGKRSSFSRFDGRPIAPCDGTASLQSASDCLCPQVSADGRADRQSAAVDRQARRQDADLGMQPQPSDPLGDTSHASAAGDGCPPTTASGCSLPHQSARGCQELRPDADVRDGPRPSEDRRGKAQTSGPNGADGLQNPKAPNGRTQSNNQESRAEARESEAARLPFSNRSSSLCSLSCKEGVELLNLEDEEKDDGIDPNFR